MKRQQRTRGSYIRYSESFKQKVVSEIETGRHTIYSAKATYGIPGDGTVYHWIRKMGKLHLLSKKIHIEMPKERDQVKDLKSEVKSLKEAMIQLQLKQLRAECDLEVAMEMLGYTDPEAFKKKLESIQSKKQ